jgi:DNA-binding XRE family transcriptional regulator
MIYAYNELYLDDAMKNLGEVFDYATNIRNLDLDGFLDLFIISGFAERFALGEPKIISGLSGTELVLNTLTKAGLENSFPNTQIEYSYSPEYWCGWILAYYQWKTCRSFHNIQENISMKEILKLYPILHETSEDKAIDTINNIISRNHKTSNLQQQRKKCGYSQSQLSRLSGVNLRTLQQYELKTKDIKKASVQTVLSLASTLNCHIEDLFEYTSNN